MAQVAPIVNVGGCLLTRTNHDLNGCVAGGSRGVSRCLSRISVNAKHETSALSGSACGNEVAPGLQTVEAIVTTIVGSSFARLDSGSQGLALGIANPKRAHGRVHQRFAQGICDGA